MSTPLTMTVFSLLIAVSLLQPMLGGGGAEAQSLPDTPELGDVTWQRDHQAALAESARTGKPIFAQFQEVPGCATCINFGKSVLSHPLLVEAIESEFVPLLVYNNRPGTDADLLKRYREPSWNNPVVRFLNGAGHDVIERADGIWDLHSIASRMVKALEEAKCEVPMYLRLLVEESSPTTKRERATFAMFCYWEGEAKLGAIDGVLATRAGWLNGFEVVELEFDPRKMSYEELLRTAKQMQCASRIFTRTDAQQAFAAPLVGSDAVRSNETARSASDGDQFYQLRHSPLRLLPLTTLQAIRVNSAIGTGGDVRHFLSPRQSELAARLARAMQADPDAFAELERPMRLDELAAYQQQLIGVI